MRKNVMSFQEGKYGKKKGQMDERFPDMHFGQRVGRVLFENVKKEGYSLGKLHPELVISYCTTYKFTVMGVCDVRYKRRHEQT